MSTKQITFSEFKMWLQGVEEMQEEGWTPSPSQWQRIKDKILSVGDQAPTIPFNQPVHRQAAPATPGIVYVDDVPRPIPTMRLPPPIDNMDPDAFAAKALPRDVGPVYNTPFK